MCIGKTKDRAAATAEEGEIFTSLMRCCCFFCDGSVCIYLLYIKSINIGIKSGNIVRRMLGAFLKVIPGKWYIYATHTAICTYDTAGAAAAANNDHFIQKLKN